MKEKRTIYFEPRQIKFLKKYQGINIQKLCRDAVDEQIKMNPEDEEFL